MLGALGALIRKDKRSLFQKDSDDLLTLAPQANDDMERDFLEDLGTQIWNKFVANWPLKPDVVVPHDSSDFAFDGSGSPPLQPITDTHLTGSGDTVTPLVDDFLFSGIPRRIERSATVAGTAIRPTSPERRGLHRAVESDISGRMGGRSASITSHHRSTQSERLDTVGLSPTAAGGGSSSSRSSKKRDKSGGSGTHRERPVFDTDVLALFSPEELTALKSCFEHSILRVLYTAEESHEWVLYTPYTHDRHWACLVGCYQKFNFEFGDGKFHHIISMASTKNVPWSVHHSNYFRPNILHYVGTVITLGNLALTVGSGSSGIKFKSMDESDTEDELSESAGTTSVMRRSKKKSSTAGGSSASGARSPQGKGRSFFRAASLRKALPSSKGATSPRKKSSFKTGRSKTLRSVLNPSSPKYKPMKISVAKPVSMNAGTVGHRRGSSLDVTPDPALRSRVPSTPVSHSKADTIDAEMLVSSLATTMSKPPLVKQLHVPNEIWHEILRYAVDCFRRVSTMGDTDIILEDARRNAKNLYLSRDLRRLFDRSSKRRIDMQSDHFATHGFLTPLTVGGTAYSSAAAVSSAISAAGVDSPLFGAVIDDAIGWDNETKIRLFGLLFYLIGAEIDTAYFHYRKQFSFMNRSKKKVAKTWESIRNAVVSSPRERGRSTPARSFTGDENQAQSPPPPRIGDVKEEDDDESVEPVGSAELRAGEKLGLISVSSDGSSIGSSAGSPGVCVVPDSEIPTRTLTRSKSMFSALSFKRSNSGSGNDAAPTATAKLMSSSSGKKKKKRGLFPRFKKRSAKKTATSMDERTVAEEIPGLAVISSTAMPIGETTLVQQYSATGESDEKAQDDSLGDSVGVTALASAAERRTSGSMKRTMTLDSLLWSSQLKTLDDIG